MADTVGIEKGCASNPVVVAVVVCMVATVMTAAAFFRLRKRRRASSSASAAPAGGLRRVARAPEGWLVGRCLCDNKTRPQLAVNPAAGAQLFGVICHCRKCQHWHGAPCAAILGFLNENIVLLGDRELPYLRNLKRNDYADSAEAQSFGARKKFCPDCGCPIVTEFESLAGTYPALFESNFSDADVVEHKWQWTHHEWLKFRNKALSDDGLPPTTLTRFLTAPTHAPVIHPDGSITFDGVAFPGQTGETI